MVAVVALGCADDADFSALPDNPPSTETTTSAPETHAPETAETPDPESEPSEAHRNGDCPNRSRGSSPAVFDENSGTYAVTIESFNSGPVTVSFDVVQWLSGQAAAEAYREEFPDEPDARPGYWVRNTNPTVRTAPVAASADVLLVRLHTDSSADVSEGTLAELPDYLDQTPLNVWWLTLDAGTVIAICEQYTP